MGALVVSRAMTPTSHRCSCSGSGCPSQWLVVIASSLLLIILVFVAAALSSDTFTTCANLPCLWGRWLMLGTTFCGPGALVHHGEELGDVMYVMRGQLL
jgi:hypothetical protein